MLNGLVRFAERRNMVVARVPSRFKRRSTYYAVGVAEVIAAFTVCWVPIFHSLCDVRLQRKRSADQFHPVSSAMQTRFLNRSSKSFIKLAVSPRTDWLIDCLMRFPGNVSRDRYSTVVWWKNGSNQLTCFCLDDYSTCMESKFGRACTVAHAFSLASKLLFDLSSVTNAEHTQIPLWFIIVRYYITQTFMGLLVLSRDYEMLKCNLNYLCHERV
jgi:hypothetical protein